jgi:predicted RNase H-like HicB family nuclease
MPVAIKDVSEKLTAIIEPSEGAYVATCPELDLATEGKTPEDALDDLIVMAMDYAEQYMEEFEIFSKSPNRAVHKLYILEIQKKGTKERVRELFT